MNAAQKVEGGLLLIQMGTELVAGRPVDALATAKKLMGIAIDLIPAAELAPFLTERDRVWADLAVDIAEAIKVDAAADEAEKDKLNP